MHVVDGARLAHHRAATVAVTRVHERRRRSTRVAHARREVAPQRDRAESLVEEDERRTVARVETHLQLRQRKRSRNKYRCTLPVAVRGNASTTSMRRGRLN